MPSKLTNKKTISPIMEIKSYGKGYLLIPTENHKDYGTKYYHNGWWMPKHNAWFFKKEYKNFLEEKFVKTKKDKIEKPGNKTDEMDFKQHGKGFLLIPPEDHPDWGTKYYHNGWWMPKYNAWFFRKNDKDSFVNTFNQIKTENKNKKYDMEISKDMVIQEYGKGYLLLPNEGHPDWGTKYYNNGWWMPKHNAWFFKKEYKDYLEKSFGKTKTDNKVKNTDKKSKMYKELLKDMVIKEYGKGYLIVPHKDHADWGTKYYHNGWWMPKHNAWFFKKNDVEELLVESEKNIDKKLFEGFKLQKYGKGYLLIVDKKHPDWGEKYYYNGWWLTKQNGWFFKKEWKSFLVENGVKMSKKPFEEDNLTFYGFKIENYGKGLLLKPPGNYSFQTLDKYYYGGWWFPKQQAWFFKKDFESFLKDNGADY
jgi:hypothetical protein